MSGTTTQLTPTATLGNMLLPKFTTNANCLSIAPLEVEKLARRKGTAFTLMVVGESGLGKSTFIRSMFGADFVVNRLAPASHQGSKSEVVSSVCKMVGEDRSPLQSLAKLAETPTNVPQQPPPRSDIHRTAEIEVYQAIVIENGMETSLTVIDTPGFGDYTNNQNNWVPIANYIDAQHQHFMIQEEQPNRSRITDSRVHLCLYFLSPTNRILELDLTAMRELSARANLVPVIAKADSMTPDDLEAFKDQIRSTLAENEIPIWHPDPHQNPPEVISKYESTWPFALVSSDTIVVNSSGREVRGRQYRWGTIEIENPEHSDFVLLRDTLFRDGMLDLMETTSTKHYSQLRRKLRLLRLKRAFGILDNNRLPQDELQITPHKQHNTHKETLSEQEQPQTHRLAPQDRASLSFLSGVLRRTKSTAFIDNISNEPPANAESEPNGARSADIPAAKPMPTPSDVSEEAAMSMGGLEVLSVISKFGPAFLDGERKESDVLLRQRALGLKAQFEVVARFQEDRFDAQAAELEHIRDQLNQDIARMNEENRVLAQEIHEMEVITKKRK